jgi:hypothetical protein
VNATKEKKKVQPNQLKIHLIRVGFVSPHLPKATLVKESFFPVGVM